MNEKRKTIGLVGAACSFACIYAASSAPIPLYTIYRENIGLSNAYLSMTSVIYFVGTVIALLIFARISNYLGRRPVTLVILGLTALGCAMFANLHTAPMFMLGRLVQGLACGLASSAIAAYIVDSAPESKAWIGTTVTGSAPMIGLASGSFGSGVLVQYGHMGLIFIIIIILIGICAVLILLGKETMPRAKGARASLIPQIRVPKNIRSLLPGASAVFVGTLAIGGFYQAFSAPMAAEKLGTKNTIIAAAVFACLQAPNVLGSFIAGKIETKKAQEIGMVAFLFSILAVVLFFYFL